MKERNYRRWLIESEGEWGIAEGQIFTNYEEREFDYIEISKRKNTKAVFGLDFGLKIIAPMCSDTHMQMW